MITSARHSLIHERARVFRWLRSLAIVVLICLSPCLAPIHAQLGALAGYSSDAPSSVSGRVLNRVTHEPISRALVFSPGNQFATLTDDRGHFEFKFPPQEKDPEVTSDGGPDANSEAARHRTTRNSRPNVYFARKPGFLSNENEPPAYQPLTDQSEITLYLLPESLIVGRVAIPGSEGSVRIRVELYRREAEEGRAHWRQAGSVTTWSDGEFRFSELPAGTYKLGTTEELDRDPSNFNINPGEVLFGYPPIFYPATNDFSAATTIQLAAGATIQANLSPPRREYFSVKIPVANAPAEQPVEVSVYPLGHPGPGYSLGYNPSEQTIEGMLPNGSYTLLADIRGQTGWIGTQNFTVNGAALDGTPVSLVPNGTLSVNVKEELQSGQSNVVEEVEIQTAGNGPQTRTSRRVLNVQIALFPLEEYGSAEVASSQRVGEREQTLFIHNVRPGRYHVAVQSGVGYAANVSSGGTDLLREPLVIGMGSAGSPIEVTVRDDGAELQGTIEEYSAISGGKSQQADTGRQVFVYFLPLGGAAQFRQTVSGDGKTFTQEQLPPGNYRVLLFDRQQPNLEYASEDVLRSFESNGQDITVDAGQKMQIRAKVIPSSELP